MRCTAKQDASHTTRFLRVVLGLLVLFVSATAQARLKVRVDRTAIGVGDTLLVVVEASGSRVDQAPNFKPLSKHFEVRVGKPESYLKFVNGKKIIQRSWRLALQPKRTGEFTIPALHLYNDHSRPISIAVSTYAPQRESKQPRQQDQFIDVQIEPKTAYIQQQVIYTARVFVTAPPIDMRISEPAPDHAIVQYLGEQRDRVKHKGKYYQVFERRYAIFAQRSGKLIVPPIRFQGVPSTGQPLNPFGPMFGSPALQRGKAMKIHSDSVTLEVIPTPIHTGDWLPAQALAIEDTPIAGEFKLGEPFTRTLTIQAKGLNAMQLPELRMPHSKFYTMYAETPVAENFTRGDSVIGKKQHKIAIVPKKIGILRLPAIEMAWWDTIKNKKAVYILPERQLNIVAPLPSLAGNLGRASESAATSKLLVNLDEANELPQEKFKYFNIPISRILTGVSIIAMLGWALTTIAWLKERRRRSEPIVQSKQQENKLHKQQKILHKAVLQACLTAQPLVIRDALLSWANLSLRPQPPRSLMALAKYIAQDPLQARVVELDQKLYRAGYVSWQAQDLAQAFANYTPPQTKKKQPQSTLLPSLNPNVG